MGAGIMAMQFLNDDTESLENAVFCFTGKSPEPRVKMTAIAINAGASVTKSVTKATTILVIADPASMSSKAVKARYLNIDLISPEQFFEMCNNNGNPISQFRMTSPKEVTVITPQESGRHSLTRRIQL